MTNKKVFVMNDSLCADLTEQEEQRRDNEELRTENAELRREKNELRRENAELRREKTKLNDKLQEHHKQLIEQDNNYSDLLRKTLELRDTYRAEVNRLRSLINIPSTLSDMTDELLKTRQSYLFLIDWFDSTGDSFPMDIPRPLPYDKSVGLD